MLDFLQDQWFVSIGGGIIVFFITNGISQWFLKRKDNSKYMEQISNANADIIRTLKPYIAEKGLPDKEIIDAIIVSTARKHNVKSDELYSIRIICEELIREIIENSYVSSDKKQEYTAQLTDYLRKLNAEQHKSILVTDIEKELKVVNSYREAHYREKLAATFSALISLLAAVLTTVVAFVAEQDLNDTELQYMVLIAAMVTLVAGTTYYIVTMRRKKKTKSKEETTVDTPKK